MAHHLVQWSIKDEIWYAMSREANAPPFEREAAIAECKRAALKHKGEDISFRVVELVEVYREKASRKK